MKISIFAYSRQGVITARNIISYCKDTHSVEFKAFTMDKYIDDSQDSDVVFEAFWENRSEMHGTMFSWSDVMIFVGATGIAVRHIAPFIKSKITDPAVISVDELGKFVIPILSGHIGGANKFALMLADKLSAVPVITTATDINNKFAVDAWAVSQKLRISSMKLAKEVSATVLEGEVPVVSDLTINGCVPAGVKRIESLKVCYQGDNTDVDELNKMSGEPRGDSKLGIYIGFRKINPFKDTLHLIPKVLHLGIGCRKGIAEEAVREAVEKVFEENQLDMRAIASAASIDIKSEEQGLLSYCKSQGTDITFYSAEELGKVEGTSSSSDFVKSITGVDNVCERSALIKADRLLVSKTAHNGVTVAVALKDTELSW